MMLIKEPKALFGGPLLGSSLVRYIYIDEAGTSAKEPVSVVVGVIINADTQWRLAERELNNVFDRFVPSQFRENFVFHAKEIWGSPKYRDGWPIEKRLKFLRRVMKIPRNLRVPIALGIQRRGSIQGPPEMDHLMAFAMCVGRADLLVPSGMRLEFSGAFSGNMKVSFQAARSIG